MCRISHHIVYDSDSLLLIFILLFLQCWKCKGTGQIIDKKKKQKQRKKAKLEELQNKEEGKGEQKTKCYKKCPVCFGKGYLPKRSYDESTITTNTVNTKNGRIITFVRKSYPLESKDDEGNDDSSMELWRPFGPLAYALEQMNQYMEKHPYYVDETKDNTKNRNKNIHPYHLLYQATKVRSLLFKESTDNNNDEKKKKQRGIYIGDDSINDTTTNNFQWLPIQHPDEQLCNLVGTWRIIQRYRNHRWTTDDLMTAYIALRETSQLHKHSSSSKRLVEDNDNTGGAPAGRERFHYLDLGCGNASVLQMVSWGLFKDKRSNDKKHHVGVGNLSVFGVEARKEAVSNARRSLLFNIGPQAQQQEQDKKKQIGGKKEEIMLCRENNDQVHILHGDFRNLVSSFSSFSSSSSLNSPHVLKSFQDIAFDRNEKFDLITGTPPYFRVDFHVRRTTSSSTQNKNTTTTTTSSQETGGTNTNTLLAVSATINQGGMPTAKQSAPARCEFRGGIEAYCYVASQLLSKPNGIFVVCENWLNHDRVLKAARLTGILEVSKIIPVVGKKENDISTSNRSKGERKKQMPSPLFAIYVMKHKDNNSSKEQNNNNDEIQDIEEEQQDPDAVMEPPISVRSHNGKWTHEYASILESMSIPAFHDADVN